MSSAIPDVDINLIDNSMTSTSLIAGAKMQARLTYQGGVLDTGEAWQIVIYTPSKAILAASAPIIATAEGVSLFAVDLATSAMYDYFRERQAHIARRLPFSLWNTTQKTAFATGYVDIVPAPFPNELSPIPIDAEDFPLFSSSLVAGSNVTITEEEGKLTINSKGGNDYATLDNKPRINGVEVVGDKTSADLGLASESALTAEETARKDADDALGARIDAIPPPPDLTPYATKVALTAEETARKDADDSIADSIPYALHTVTDGQLADRSVNVLTAGGNLTFPRRVEGKAREFLVSFSTTGGVPPVRLVGYGSLKSADPDIWKLEADKEYLYLFSEVAAGAFVVGRLILAEAPVPPAQEAAQ